MPFAFIPAERPVAPTQPPQRRRPWSRPCPSATTWRSSFPKLDGYRIEMPDELALRGLRRRRPPPRRAATRWRPGSQNERHRRRGRGGRPRAATATPGPSRWPTSSAGELVPHASTRPTRPTARPWLFPRLVRARQALARRRASPSTTTPSSACCCRPRTATRPPRSCSACCCSRRATAARCCCPMLQPLRPRGLHRRRRLRDPQDGDRRHQEPRQPRGARRRRRATPGRRAWPASSRATAWCAAFVKNDHLGFKVPYVHQGRSHDYVPDFLVRLVPQRRRRRPHPDHRGVRQPEVARPTKAKADTARHQWCVAVNNHGGWGRWGYVELGRP